MATLTISLDDNDDSIMSREIVISVHNPEFLDNVMQAFMTYIRAEFGYIEELHAIDYNDGVRKYS